jgi:hypothetical protein
MRRRFTFRRTELHSALDKAIAEARQLRRQRPEMVVVPMQNEAVVARDEEQLAISDTIQASSEGQTDVESVAPRDFGKKLP